MLIVLDPGHQALPDAIHEPVSPCSHGTKPRCAPGSRGVLTRQEEHRVVLDVALEAVEVIDRDRSARTGDLRVHVTRSAPDVDLSNRERAELANESGADLFVRLHADGWRDRRGLLVGWLHAPLALVGDPRTGVGGPAEHARALHAASVLLRHVAPVFGRSRGIRIRDDLTGLNWAACPAVLLEIGSLGHPRHDLMLRRPRFRKRVATAVAEGLLEVTASWDQLPP